jgi:hypothetical protein
MSSSNGKLASLGENCILVVFACDSSSSAPRHFHCLARYPVARWCTLNFPQQSQVNTYDGKYGGVKGDEGCNRGGKQGVKGKEFQCKGRQAALMAESGAPDLGFG